METILEKIMSFLCKDNEYDSDQKEIIKYGLEVGILKTVFGTISLCIGILLNCIVECVIYFISFIFLRSNAGGYHAKSRSRCFIQSLITEIIALLLIKYFFTDYPHIIISYAVATAFSFLIYIYAPVDSENKKLKSEERKYFKIKTRLILLTEIFLVLIGIGLNFNLLVYPIVLAIITSGMLLLMSKFIQHTEKAS